MQKWPLILLYILYFLILQFLYEECCPLFSCMKMMYACASWILIHWLTGMVISISYCTSIGKDFFSSGLHAVFLSEAKSSALFHMMCYHSITRTNVAILFLVCACLFVQACSYYSKMSFSFSWGDPSISNFFFLERKKKTEIFSL